MNKNIEFFSLNKNFGLAKKVSDYFKKRLHIPKIIRFADTEITIKIPYDIDLKEKEAVVIYSTADPVNENIMQFIFLIDRLKQMGVTRVHAIIPYFGYSRQCVDKDKMMFGNAKIVAKMIEIAGVGSVAVVEAHDKTLSSFFTVPCANIKVTDLLVNHIKTNCHHLDDCCLVAPDAGAKERVEALAQVLELPTLFFTKKRYDVNKVKIVESTGQLTCKHAIIIDDIIDTGSTAIQVADVLIGQGAESVSGYFVHPVLSADVVQRLETNNFKKLFVSNSISLLPEEKIKKIDVFDISDALITHFKKRMNTRERVTSF